MSKEFKIAVLISGRGSNMTSILEAIKQGKIEAIVDVVISNNKEAKGLAVAEQYKIETKSFSIKEYSSRLEYDRAIIEFLKPRKINLVILAGYMLILGKEFIEEYKENLINIHPSLLPSFPGTRSQKKALDYGVKLSGCTVHFVTEGADEGPIITQSAVPVLEGDTEERLSQRILKEEHKIFPEVIKKFVEGKVKFKRSNRHEKSIN